MTGASRSQQIMADQVQVHTGGPREAPTYIDQLVQLYETDFFDPSFPEHHAAIFKRRIREKIQDATTGPNFRIVILWSDEILAGFIYGCSLPATTGYWKKVRETLSDEFTAETGERTLAIFVLVVKRDLRGQRFGSMLHEALLKGRSEDRAVLLSEAATQPAYTIWQHWGYQKVGSIQPAPDESVRDVFVRELKSPSPSRERNLDG